MKRISLLLILIVFASLGVFAGGKPIHIKSHLDTASFAKGVLVY